MLNLPGFRLQSQLYESASSLVFRAVRAANQQAVILKVLKKDYPTPQELKQYRCEYEITRGLACAGVVQVYELRPYQNTLVIVLEDFGGTALADWLTEYPFSITEILQLAVQITTVLQQVHQQQVIHKDINPANIVWNPATGQLKLIDFGIATQVTRENPTIRNPQVLEGTLAYMSPEQTGRMNRSLDYRTDYYSLGVTLYHLLSGHLPFQAEDALELVYSHLAKQPPPLTYLADGTTPIPPMVAAIAQKLMAKTAEDRYQSEWGLQADLVRCLEEWQATGAIAPFPLGQHDRLTQLQIPQKLYGRSPDIAQLLAAFERVATAHHAELMMVTGYAGVGKTSLVRELYKPITQQKGYFLAGKFDQYQRNIPYAAFVDACAHLIGQLLTESETQLAQWRTTLLATLAPNAQVLIEVIPQLELILGPQPAIAPLMPTEAQNRFNRVLQQFIQVLATPEHPLVLFLDDLQWADAASLQLIQVLLTGGQGALLVLGAYRDNEITPTHPLLHTLDLLHKAQIPSQTIALNPLQLADIQALLSDTFQRSPTATAPLAELLLTKTAGNPFFMNEFLYALYVEGLLTVDAQGHWEWSIAQIQQHGLTDNVVELMVNKIQRLAPAVQLVIQRAACIGNEFDSATVAAVLAVTEQATTQTETGTIAALRTASQEGLVVVLEPDDTTQNPAIAKPRYQFAHDRIQQAAYSLNSEGDRQVIHHYLGHYLFQHAQQAEPTVALHQIPALFAIVNHLNLAPDYLQTGDARQQLAELNLAAGEKAKQSAAYAAALSYFKASIHLLPPAPWHGQYEFCLALYSAAVEAAYLQGDLAQMAEWVVAIETAAQTPLDLLRIYTIQIQAACSQMQFLAALQLGLDGLAKLGVRFPTAPTPQVLELSFQQTQTRLGDRAIASLKDLPAMTDPTAQAISHLLTNLLAPAYQAAPALFPLLILKMVDVSLEFGNNPLSAFAYSAYGNILSAVRLEIEAGYEFGQLAIAVLEQFPRHPISCKTLFMVNTCIRFRKVHLQATIPGLYQAYQLGLENGDLEFAGYSLLHHCDHCFFVGMPLPDLEPKLATSVQALTTLNDSTNANALRVYQQTVLNLMIPRPVPGELTGTAYTEAQELPLLQAANHHKGLFYLYFNKLLLCYHFGEFEAAIANATLAAQFLDGGRSNAVFPIYYFYDSLARLAAYPTAPPPRQSTLLEQVAANQALMERWATHAPMNYLHKWRLVEAERYQVLGNFPAAIAAYEQAADLAQTHDYLHETALVYERTALFYQAQAKPLIAKTYFQEAAYRYQQWGAKAKVQQLERAYPDYFRILARLTPGAIAAPGLVTTNSQASATLDIATVIKASQALSSELNLQRLLTQLMTLVLENAGATTGFLLLNQAEQLRLVASGSATAITLDPPDRPLPQEFLQYIARTKEPVVLDNIAQAEPFATLPYFQTHTLTSVLGLPILGQGKLLGVLYLENHLASAAFTTDRVAILRLLTAQAAIALENAQLYTQLATYSQTLEHQNQTLEQEIRDRRLAEDQLRETLAEKEVLLKEIHHRVKNNLQIISGLLQLQAQSIDDPNTITILKESRNRIEAMALIHKKLYFSAEFGHIDMVDYIPNLTASLLMAYQISPSQITLQTAIEPITLNIDLAIPCGLIVNELVSNALKHAFRDGRTGQIRVTLKSLPNSHVQLTVWDNGVGLPETLDWEYTQSLGLSLVRDLATAQLEGTFVVEREQGTLFEMTFPLLLP